MSRHERKKRREDAIYKWHRKFALLPKVIPEEKHDAIVVPRHLLWLESYETKREYSRDWSLRTWRGAKTLKQIVEDT